MLQELLCYKYHWYGRKACYEIQTAGYHPNMLPARNQSSTTQRSQCKLSCNSNYIDSLVSACSGLPEAHGEEKTVKGTESTCYIHTSTKRQQYHRSSAHHLEEPRHQYPFHPKPQTAPDVVISHMRARSSVCPVPGGGQDSH